MDDLKIIELTLKGDKEIYAELVRRYQNHVCKIAYSYLRDYDLALDVSQDVFLKAFRALGTFDASYTFLAWISRITVNHCLDIVRRHVIKKTASSDEFDAEDLKGIRPDAEADRNETKERVLGVIETMPVNYRTVIMLKDIQDMPFEEISKALDVNGSTLRWRLHMARKMFKKLWSKQELAYDKH